MLLQSEDNLEHKYQQGQFYRSSLQQNMNNDSTSAISIRAHRYNPFGSAI